MRDVWNLSWEVFGQLALRLAQRIEHGGKQYKGIYGVPRGGLPLATTVAYYLDVPLVFSSEEADLIIDDISDSGSTFIKLIGDRRIDTAVLFISNTTDYMPTYYVEPNNEKWINFPYEHSTKPDTHSTILNS